jgi:YidC/Oxa1 family membrane protein insertase
VGDFFGAIGNLFSQIFVFPIFNVLMLLYHLFGDFGLSIVVLTLLIKLVLFPLTLQQLKSMKANQALQPHMQEIRRKYAKDQQAQMLAMQNLYKEYGVNPMSGCLPLLVQMPVLYGLYYALSTVVRSTDHNINAHLYPFVRAITNFTHFPNVDLAWFSWLSFLNPIFHVNWSWTISLASPDPSHVLPIIAALATFVQLRMSMARTASVAAKTASSDGKAAPSDPTQQTMKTMQYIMPFFTLFIGWNFPAGLALYWTVSSIFQAVQQYFVTGWGSLLTVPSLKSKTTGAALPAHNANGATPKTVDSTLVSSTTDSEEEGATEDEEDEEDEDRPGPVAKKMHTTPTPRLSSSGNPYPTTRRTKGGSSSARRRSTSQRSRR